MVAFFNCSIRRSSECKWFCPIAVSAVVKYRVVGEVLGHNREFVSRVFSPFMLREAEVCANRVSSVILGGLSRLQLNQLNVLVLWRVSVGGVGLLGLSTAQCKDVEPAGLNAVVWAIPVQTHMCLSANQLRSDQAHQLWLVSAALATSWPGRSSWCFCLVLSSVPWFGLPSQPWPCIINTWLEITSGIYIYDSCLRLSVSEFKK